MKPNKIEYTDEVDFISSKSYVDLDTITPIMTTYYLIINKDKTEYVKLKRDSDSTKEKKWSN